MSPYHRPEVQRLNEAIAALPPCPRGCTNPYPTPTFNTTDPLDAQVDATIQRYQTDAPRMLQDHYANEHPTAAATQPDEHVTIARTDLDRLLAVATLYLDSFGPGEKFSLGGLMALQGIEETVERHGRRY